MKIIILGSGRLATQLALALCEAGLPPLQIYSRTMAHAQRLAHKLSPQTEPIDSIAALRLDADYYILALSDAALPDLIAQMPSVDAVLAHTAGSVPMSVFEGKTSSYGVFYPLQTFSLDRKLNFAEIPLYIEANGTESLAKLNALASKVSKHCYEADSSQRKALHLAAVFACNFTNHMYSISQALLSESHLPPSSLAALISETAAKAALMPAIDAQTGPAMRGDASTMQAHQQLLTAHPEWQELYTMLSDDIQRMQANRGCQKLNVDTDS